MLHHGSLASCQKSLCSEVVSLPVDKCQSPLSVWLFMLQHMGYMVLVRTPRVLCPVSLLEPQDDMHACQNAQGYPPCTQSEPHHLLCMFVRTPGSCHASLLDPTGLSTLHPSEHPGLSDLHLVKTPGLSV